MKLVAKNLTLAYQTGKNIIDGIDFEIEDHTLVSLLGPSGSGKSTILNMIAGLLTPTSGEIYFADRAVTKLSVAERNIGMVFQNYALYPNMTVRNNIAFPLKIAKIAKNERKQEIERLAKLVHIEDQLDKRPGELSGGQQQRVAIARALARKPAVLLLDEPLSNLDAKLRTEMRVEIARIQQATGVTTIFVTHDQNEAMHISDKIMLLSDGVIQQYAAPNDLYDKPANLFTAKFIGDPQINTFDKAEALAYLQNYFAKQVKTIGIRPDAISTIKNSSSVELPVTLKSYSKYGPEQLSRFDFFGAEFDGENVDGISEAEVGQPLKVYVPASAIHGFDDSDRHVLALKPDLQDLTSSIKS
ncbi:ABC transporter ATP-binding protein [Oenococcus sicerae]|uniref:ABC transporter ATP-binding protein n=1 Tax=Oenococcus sicerae TaxID=2203724 RepID=UPI0010B252F7|nr:Trehalose/maltose import ATP-binding protein MalK [Oenococcus sicerae]